MPKTLKDLTVKDSIAFWDMTNGVIVAKPTAIYEDRTVLVHYLYDGYKSTSQILTPEDILAIGNEKSEGTIDGWHGKYDILQPDRLERLLSNKQKKINS